MKGPGLLLLCLMTLARAQGVPDLLDLPTAETLALRHNPLLAQAKARTISATSQVDLVVASSRPQLRALADAAYDDKDSGGGGSSSGNGGSSNPERWNAEIRADIPLLSSGRLDARLDQTRQLALAQGLEEQATAARVLLQVRHAFLRAQLAGHRVSVQSGSLELLGKQAEDNRRRHEAGALPRLAYLQAQVAVENARPELQRALREQGLAIEALFAAMGLSLPANAVAAEQGLADTWPFLPEPPVDLQACLALARARRPELRALEAEAAAARRSADFEKRVGYPDLDGFARYGFDNNGFGDGDDVRNGWMVGLNFVWPLFDGGSVKSKVRDAQAREAETLARRETLWQGMEVSIRDAWSARELAVALSHTADARVNLAEETLKLALESQANGRATQLDVLQAELGLTQARLDRLAAEHDRLRALADLAYAIGHD